jgi:hypothetical protein
MYSPHLNEKVTVRGCSGEFLVLTVDSGKERADLARLSDVPCLVENVPLADILSFRRSMPADREKAGATSRRD